MFNMDSNEDDNKEWQPLLLSKKRSISEEEEEEEASFWSAFPRAALPLPILRNLLLHNWRHARKLARLCRAFAAVFRSKAYWRAVATRELGFRLDAERIALEPAERATYLREHDPLFVFPIQMPLLPQLPWHAFLRFLWKRAFCYVCVDHVRFRSFCGKYCLSFEDDGCIRLYRIQNSMPGFVLAETAYSWAKAAVINGDAPQFVLQPGGLWYIQIDNEIRWMRSSAVNGQEKRWYGTCVEDNSTLRMIPGSGWWA